MQVPPAWQSWSRVPLTQRSSLPSASGIYAIVDATGRVWYVGQATNLQTRWSGKAHHRYPQLIRSNRQLEHWIYWKLVPTDALAEQERDYIAQFQPELNGSRVKRYLPKQPVVDREIKRLLNVLNRPTLLFPVVRSVMLGAYDDESATRCMLIAIYLNDMSLLAYSMQKRSTKLKAAWSVHHSSCGKTAELHRPSRIPRLQVETTQIEFIELSPLMRYLEHNPAVLATAVQTVELFGASVKVLNDLGILYDLEFEQTFGFVGLDGKQALTDAAYLTYRLPFLKCLN